MYVNGINVGKLENIMTECDDWRFDVFLTNNKNRTRIPKRALC